MTDPEKHDGFLCQRFVGCLRAPPKHHNVNDQNSADKEDDETYEWVGDFCLFQRGMFRLRPSKDV
jgi:hypothetical protein